MKSKLLFMALISMALAAFQTSMLVDGWSQSTQCAPAKASANYNVVFNGVWSNQTHPNENFPSNPHFSGLIGATHNVLDLVWAPGGFSTPGIENMAETGGKSPLDSEINQYIADGVAENLLSGGGINPSPDNVALNFDISTAYPYVSLVSMIAPSPDWFVGVYNQTLCEGNAWVEEMVIELLSWDAGTDSGTTYTAPNLDTNPRVPISLLNDTPFVFNDELRPLGTFTFTLQSVSDDGNNSGNGSDSVESAIASLVSNNPSGSDADFLIGDDEILQAIGFWVAGSTVPGTSQIISDVTIRSLIDKWILQEPISN